MVIQSVEGQVNVPYMVEMARRNTGFAAWKGAGNYYSIVGTTFTLLRGGSGMILGRVIEWDPNNQRVTLVVNQTNFVYIDQNGRLQVALAPSDALYRANIVLFAVLYDGTITQVCRENHDFAVPVDIHRLLHNDLGTISRVRNGALISMLGGGGGGVAADRELQLTNADVIDDEGVVTSVPDSTGVHITVNVFYANAGGHWVRDSQITELPMEYNNAGVPAGVTVDSFGLYRIYALKDTGNALTPQYLAVMHSAEYLTLGEAQAVVDADGADTVNNELAELEPTHLGIVIFQNNALGGTIISVQPVKNQLSGISNGTLAAQALIRGHGVGERVVRSLLTDPAEVVTQGTWAVQVDATLPFNAAYDNSTADANNDDIDLHICVPATGTWTLRFNAPTNVNCGILKVDLDNVNIGVGAGYDLYAAVPDPLAVIEIAGLAISAGAHTLRLYVDGANGASGGHEVYLNQIELKRTA